VPSGSIGEALTSARESAGLSVEQVCAATRIRRTLLEAIERDDLVQCGGDFYARGHIRTIAATVGTDPAPLLAQFDAEHAGSAPPRAAEVFEPDTARPEHRGPNWTAAMLAALVLVVGYGVVSAVRDDGTGRPVAGANRSASQAPTNAAASSPPLDGGSMLAQAHRNRVTVVLRARDLSWVQATTASGKELFQGLLERGQVRTFTARARVKLVVGNAGAVVLTVNGTHLGTAGRAGQVARVQFTPHDPVAG
jgi:cytoskeleton protein RodZ